MDRSNYRAWLTMLVFTGLRSNGDRAILGVGIDNGARAVALLGVGVTWLPRATPAGLQQIRRCSSTGAVSSPGVVDGKNPYTMGWSSGCILAQCCKERGQ